MFLRTDLLHDGARVVMTRDNNRGVGPCVTRRAEILNHSHANVAIDIHADGGPPTGRGFSILEPVPDGPNDKVIAASESFGRSIRREFLRYTKMPVSNYYGIDGISYRNDLAGLNLTRLPKVLIECGNMRNTTDAALLVSAAFQRRVARALEAAIILFLARANRTSNSKHLSALAANSVARCLASDDNGAVRGRFCERRQISRIAGQDPVARAGQPVPGRVQRSDP